MHCFLHVTASPCTEPAIAPHADDRHTDSSTSSHDEANWTTAVRSTDLRWVVEREREKRGKVKWAIWVQSVNREKYCLKLLAQKRQTQNSALSEQQLSLVDNAITIVGHETAIRARIAIHAEYTKMCPLMLSAAARLLAHHLCTSFNMINEFKVSVPQNNVSKGWVFRWSIKCFVVCEEVSAWKRQRPSTFLFSFSNELIMTVCAIIVAAPTVAPTCTAF